MIIRTRAQFFARYTVDLFFRQTIKAHLVQSARGARYVTLSWRLADPLQLNDAIKLANPLALATNTTAVIAQRLPEKPGLVTYQFELRPGLWQSYTRQDVTGLGVGLGESKQQIDFSFDPPHSLVAGTTDSGKTETVKSVLSGLATEYSPDDLEMVIIDPHTDYDQFDNLAHLVTPIARTNDEIDNAIMWVAQELADRRDRNARDAKRCVVVIDEAEDALSNPKRLAVVQKTGSEARKFRMNLIVSTQKPQQKNLPDLVDKLNNRWVGLVDNAHTSALLTGQAGMQAHKLTGKGDFVHVAGATQDRLQVAMATTADYARLPRTEIHSVVVDKEDTPRVLNMPDSKGPGRPETEIEPRKVAFYVFALRHGLKVTIGQAEKFLGLKRYAHYAHREFAHELSEQLQKLEKRGVRT